jgi:Prokaryotic homologs of the JAB domain
VTVRCGHRFVLVLYTQDGATLGQVAADPDWEPARQCASFAALCQARLPTTAEAVAVRAVSVRPLWLDAGEPFVSGFRLSLALDSCGEFSWEFTTAYFRALAQQASTYFVEQGKLRAGETVKFLMAAFPRQEPAAPEAKPRFVTEELEPTLRFGADRLGELTRHATPVGVLDADLMPVVIPGQVLREAAALSRGAGARETGGILIGRLHRDPGLGAIFARITAQLPARHAEATVASLTFTKETWTQVQTALDLRKKNELMLGWWHSHPARELCKECPLERQQVCRLAKDYYSAHDHALHRAVFPKAFSVGLVVNDVSFSEPTFSLFGWNQGVLRARGFYAKEE